MNVITTFVHVSSYNYPHWWQTLSQMVRDKSQLGDTVTAACTRFEHRKNKRVNVSLLAESYADVLFELAATLNGSSAQ